ncbi:MAG: DUF1508 domain-containing protein [Pseudomonadota bacterium]
MRRRGVLRRGLTFGALAMVFNGARQNARASDLCAGRRFEYYRRADGRWDWRLIGANGFDIIATSGNQGYENLDACLAGIKSVQAAGAAAIVQ